jgi:protein O-GlcNAc transferase
MMEIDQLLQLAMDHHQAGRTAEAEHLYLQILESSPENSQALHLRGVLAAQTKRFDLAVESIQKAIAVNPIKAEYHGDLGNTFAGQNQYEKAQAAYERAVELKPDFIQAHFNLAIAYENLGKLPQAVAEYQLAVKHKPDFLQACFRLALALSTMGNLDEAIDAYRKVIRLWPEIPEAHLGLGNALNELGKFDEAFAEYQTALRLRPNWFEAHFNFGYLLTKAGRLKDAISEYRKAITLQPDYAEAHFNLANLLKDTGESVEAITEYQNALRLEPDYVDAHLNLGNFYKIRARFDEAAAEYRKILQLEPTHAGAMLNQGIILQEQGDLHGALTAYDRALEFDPTSAETRSNLLLALHYLPKYDESRISEQMRRWNENHLKPLAQFRQPHFNDRDPNRRLRIGYVSADFRQHSVAYFFENLLAHHNRDEVEVFCYANHAFPDAVTQRLQTYPSSWRSIIQLDDPEAEALIRKDLIDILIDLSGHTGANRMTLFARKPAPIQVTYLGYPDITGLSTIDYRFTDAYADPPGEIHSFPGEQLVRLPDTFLCYRPWELAPEPQETPARKTGYITFGSFNALPKFNAPMIALWSEILRQVPGSRLLLKNAGLAGERARNWVAQLFNENGISSNRIDLRATCPALEHHKLYHRMDINLDTYPYHGTTTTCEALWMGLPCVTLAGQAHLSRVGISLLTNIGLSELIAHSPEQYLQIAVTLASDLDRLQTLRSSMRQRMSSSPLMDAPRFSKNVEAAYRAMWQRWCQQN